MGQHECMVGSLSVPNRIESVVLSASCGLDVVDFFSDCSRTNHKWSDVEPHPLHHELAKGFVSIGELGECF